ncbi:MAG: hypothetical protein ACP5H7_03050 [Minisyncoccia bacterium]
MNFYSTFCFGAGILSFFAGFLVLLANKKNRLSQSWFLFNLSIAIWIINLGGTMFVDAREIALLFQKILYVGTHFHSCPLC